MLDDLPDELIWELSAKKLGPEVIRLRNIIADQRKVLKSRRKRISHLRGLMRKRHEQFRNLRARLGLV